MIRRHIGWALGATAILSMFVGCMVGSSSSTRTSAVSSPPSNTVTKTVTAEPSSITVEKEASAPQISGGPRTTFGDGTWEIGVDIAPGKYKSAGPDSSGMGSCFAQTEKTGDGSLGDIKDQDVSRGPMTFTIPANGVRIFKTNGCQDWKKA